MIVSAGHCSSAYKMVVRLISSRSPPSVLEIATQSRLSRATRPRQKLGWRGCRTSRSFPQLGTSNVAEGFADASFTTRDTIDLADSPPYHTCCV